jgi:broad specificity phosphatase PhoE
VTALFTTNSIKGHDAASSYPACADGGDLVGRISTWMPGEPLTDEGLAQADSLASSRSGTPLAGVYASEMIRTQQTGEPLARVQGLTVEVIPGLREIEGGDLEGLDTPESMRDYMTPLLTWGKGDFTAAIPGAHDGNHFFDRFDSGIASIVGRHDDDATVVLISHEGCIRVWVAGRANNIGPEYTSTHPLNNVGVVELTGNSRDGWHADRWQDEMIPGTVKDASGAGQPGH